MNCSEARATFMEQGDVESVNRHGAECAECRRMFEDLDSHRRLLGDEGVWVIPPQGLGDRVEKLISGRRGSVRECSRRWLWPTAAAVGAVVIALAAWINASAPDWEVVMVGAHSSRQIDAPVAGWNTPSGTRLVVDASELEAAPDGFVYEMWLSNGRVALSAGSFVGGEPVDMFIGASRSDYPRLWVTLEPLDNDQSPSGEMVVDTG